MRSDSASPATHDRERNRSGRNCRSYPRAISRIPRTHHGHPVAYFDGPGGTQVPRAVVEAMTDYLFHHNANTHWAYPTSEETDAMIEDARTTLADFLNASPNEIVFGANMTTLTFHLARALGRDISKATRLSSRSWTITPMSRRGARSKKSAASKCARRK